MASFHNWTGDEEIDTQVPQFLNEDNAATQEKLDTKFNKSLDIAEASDLNNFKNEGFYCCNSNSRAETILNCPTNYAFGLMVWGKEDIFYQEVREFNRGSNQDYNNCWRRSYYSDGGQGVWSNWQQMSYVATTLAGYGITDGMRKTDTAAKATADGAGNVIVDTYAKKTDIPNIIVDAELSDTSTNPIQNKAVKTAIDTVTASIPTKVSALENDAGYLTKHQSLEYEKYVSYVISGAASQPASSVMQYTATGAFTLNLSSISSKLAAKEATVFTAYIKSDADYTLTITNAGTIKYIGSASDVAITSAGLLLNIMMLKDNSGNVTSIVQASKLS